MDKAEFLRQEYGTLRAEIAAGKGRVHRLAAASVLLLPPALFGAWRSEAFPLALFVPPAVAALSILLLSEQVALMRCGRYIKVYIEHGIDGAVGWEHWLETRDQATPRSVDRAVAFLFQALYLASYAFASVLAVLALHERYAVAAPVVGALLYALGAAGLAWFLVRNLRLAVSTGGEDTCLKALLLRPHCLFGPESD